jgi:hypothetical protein
MSRSSSLNGSFEISQNKKLKDRAIQSLNISEVSRVPEPLPFSSPFNPTNRSTAMLSSHSSFIGETKPSKEKSEFKDSQERMRDELFQQRL